MRSRIFERLFRSALYPSEERLLRSIFNEPVYVRSRIDRWGGTFYCTVTTGTFPPNRDRWRRVSAKMDISHDGGETLGACPTDNEAWSRVLMLYPQLPEMLARQYRKLKI